MLNRNNMHSHQKRVSEFIVDKASTGGCLCILDVGGGKTVSTLDAIATLSDNFCFNKCLDWAEGLPVSAEGEVTERYWK